MINFFRKIRRKFADNNQFLKYSRYAIGEIVLVVVGILIALYINNKNEERKSEELTLIVFKEIQKDIKKTLLDVDDCIKYYSTIEMDIRSILSDTLYANDYRDNPGLKNVALYACNLRIYRDGFDKLNNSIPSMSIKQNEIFNNVTTLYKNLEQMEIESDILYDEIMLFHRALAKEVDWYSRIQTSKQAIDYFMNDPLYKNQVQLYRMDLLDYNLIEIKSELIRTYYLLSSLTMVNELTGLYLDYTKLDLESYEGVYQFVDSTTNIQFGKKRIYVQDGLLNYHSDGYTFHQLKKDSFAFNYNNTLYFQRDSSDQIIGVTRYINGYSPELKKIE